MMLRIFTLAAVIPALAACSAQMDEEDRMANVPPGNAIGEAVSCIPTNRIENTNVHNDFVIDFQMAGDTVYRNVLPNRCFSLGFEERFAYETTTGQLCDLDTVTVLHADGSRGTTCGLGEFLPIEIDENRQ